MVSKVLSALVSVKAVSDTDENESPFSETVWTVVASEREGDYVHEKRYLVLAPRVI